VTGVVVVEPPPPPPLEDDETGVGGVCAKAKTVESAIAILRIRIFFIAFFFFF